MVPRRRARSTQEDPIMCSTQHNVGLKGQTVYKKNTSLRSCTYSALIPPHPCGAQAAYEQTQNNGGVHLHAIKSPLLMTQQSLQQYHYTLHGRAPRQKRHSSLTPHERRNILRHRQLYRYDQLLPPVVQVQGNRHSL